MGNLSCCIKEQETIEAHKNVAYLTLENNDFEKKNVKIFEFFKSE